MVGTDSTETTRVATRVDLITSFQSIAKLLCSQALRNDIEAQNVEGSQADKHLLFRIPASVFMLNLNHGGGRNKTYRAELGASTFGHWRLNRFICIYCTALDTSYGDRLCCRQKDEPANAHPPIVRTGFGRIAIWVATQADR